jgi:hypothetical protein
MIIELFFNIFLMFICGMFCYGLAIEKNLNNKLAFLIGFCFNFIAIIVYCFLKPKNID